MAAVEYSVDTVSCCFAGIHLMKIQHKAEIHTRTHQIHTASLILSKWNQTTVCHVTVVDPLIAGRPWTVCSSSSSSRPNCFLSVSVCSRVFPAGRWLHYDRTRWLLPARSVRTACAASPLLIIPLSLTWSERFAFNHLIGHSYPVSSFKSLCLDCSHYFFVAVPWVATGKKKLGMLPHFQSTIQPLYWP